MPEWIPKRQIDIDLLFSMKLLIGKRRELSFETHLTFLDCVNALGKVKRDKLFSIIHSKNIPNLLLMIIAEIYHPVQK